MPDIQFDISKLRNLVMAKHVEIVTSDCKHKNQMTVHGNDNGHEHRKLVCRDCGVELEDHWVYDNCKMYFYYDIKSVAVDL